MKNALLFVLLTVPATAHGWWGGRNRCPREDFSAEVDRARDEAGLDCRQIVSLIEYQRGRANRASAAAAAPMVGPARSGSSVPVPPGLLPAAGLDDIMTIPDEPTDHPSGGSDEPSKDADPDMAPKPSAGDPGSTSPSTTDKP